MELDGQVFWWVGGALVLAALVISFVGIRGKESFPANSRVMAGALVAFGLLVAVTAAYSVANAREEQEHRNEELAQEQAEGEEGVSEAEAESEPSEDVQEGEAPPEGQQTPSAGQALTVDLSSPEDGSLVFEPDSIQTEAGSLTLAYANPSPVAHNVAVEDAEQELLGESETITSSETELTVDVAPGEYAYFCTVPGHRQGGMEGTLTVE